MPTPWYHDGLAFQCTQCGDCCTGTPGYVWVTDAEVAALAKHLDVSVGEVIQRHTRLESPGWRTLIEKPNNDCTFFEAGRGCTVYAARPTQCRTWPFWPNTASTPREWTRTQSACPGAGRGPLISAEEITQRIRATRLP